MFMDTQLCSSDAWECAGSSSRFLRTAGEGGVVPRGGRGPRAHRAGLASALALLFSDLGRAAQSPHLHSARNYSARLRGLNEVRKLSQHRVSSANISFLHRCHHHRLDQLFPLLLSLVVELSIRLRVDALTTVEQLSQARHQTQPRKDFSQT